MRATAIAISLPCQFFAETHSQTALLDAWVFRDVPAKRSFHCGAALLQSTSGQLDFEG